MSIGTCTPTVPYNSLSPFCCRAYNANKMCAEEVERVLDLARGEGDEEVSQELVAKGE